MRIDVPAPDAPISELSDFALRYYAYGRNDVEGIADITDAVRAAWSAGTLPTDLDELRTALFFVQRQYHWNNFFDLEFARALIEQIRTVSGGTVEGSAGITV